MQTFNLWEAGHPSHSPRRTTLCVFDRMAVRKQTCSSTNSSSRVGPSASQDSTLDSSGAAEFVRPYLGAIRVLLERDSKAEVLPLLQLIEVLGVDIACRAGPLTILLGRHSIEDDPNDVMVIVLFSLVKLFDVGVGVRRTGRTPGFG
jgi:hypothetical protein